MICDEHTKKQCMCKRHLVHKKEYPDSTQATPARIIHNLRHPHSSARLVQDWCKCHAPDKSVSTNNLQV